MTKSRSTDIVGTIVSKDAKIGDRDPRLKKDRKTLARAKGLRKEGKIRVQPTASTQDKKIDPTLAMLKSDDKTDDESFSARKLPLNQRDQKLLKMLDCLQHDAEKRVRDLLRLLERLEREQRNRMEEVRW